MDLKLAKKRNLKQAVICVSNDIVTDQRIHRTANVLAENNIQVCFIGRKLKSSQAIPNNNFSYKRFTLLFNSGALFYANLNIRLLFYLLFAKFDFIIANDLDTLLPAFLIHKLKKKPLIYDSHEYFTGVPELEHRNFQRNTWKTIERLIFPKLKNIITVNRSIALLYEQEYKKEITVVRNISPKPAPQQAKFSPEFEIPEKFILIQGTGINMNRGGKEAVLAMKFIEDKKLKLLIIGKGDAIPELQQLCETEKLHSKVEFHQPLPYDKLMCITKNAWLGLSLDIPESLNYKFSLPNKLFDYIHAQIPILCSRAIEVQHIVEMYSIGMAIHPVTPENIAKAINKIATEPKLYTTWKDNLETASAELNWENEKLKLENLFKKAGLIQ